MLVVGLELQAHAQLRHENDVILSIAQCGTDQLVGVLAVFVGHETHCDQAALTRGIVFGERGLLDLAGTSGEHQVLGHFVVRNRQHGLDRLVRAELQQVGHMLSLGIARSLRQLVSLQTVHASLVGEEQQPVVRAGEEEVVDHVVLTQLGSLDALATTVLRTVFVGLGALDETGVGDGHDHVFFRNQIFDVHFTGVRQDLGSTFVAILGHDFVKLVAHDLALALRLGENVVVVGDATHQFVVLVEDLLTFQCGQSAQLHGQNGVGLHFIHVQQVHKARARGFRGFGSTNKRDDLVDHVEGLQIALQNVVAFLRLTLEVCGTACDDFQLVAHPMADEGIQRQRARHTVDQRQHVGTEGLLQLGVLVQVVEHDLRHGVALEHEHETLAGTTGGFVAHVGDALDLAVAHRFADGDDQSVRVHLVRQLGDHEAHAALDLFGVHHRAHGDQTTAGTVGLFDALMSENRCASREVRSFDDADQVFEQLFATCVRVVERPMHAFGHLAHVVRRNVGGHTDGDTGRTVAQQVRESCRKHGRLLCLAIVVRQEIDGVFVDVANHFHGERSHTAFGVTHCRGRIVAGGAEVALAVDQRVAHRPRLCHTHQRVVDCGIAVRMVLTHHFADHAGALGVAAVGAVAAVVHRVDHTAMHRFHAVAHVRERTVHDHGHGVCQVGIAHFLLQILLLDAFAHHQAVIGVVGLLRAQRLHGAVRHELAVFVAVVFVCQLLSPSKSL